MRVRAFENSMISLLLYKKYDPGLEYDTWRKFNAKVLDGVAQMVLPLIFFF